jgi:hypothetical protein
LQTNNDVGADFLGKGRGVDYPTLSRGHHGQLLLHSSSAAAAQSTARRPGTVIPPFFATFRQIFFPPFSPNYCSSPVIATLFTNDDDDDKDKETMTSASANPPTDTEY